MARYYKFHYDAGYTGTEIEEVIKYNDDISDKRVQLGFSLWCEEKRTDCYYLEEISEEEANELGIDYDNF